MVTAGVAALLLLTTVFVFMRRRQMAGFVPPTFAAGVPADDAQFGAVERPEHVGRSMQLIPYLVDRKRQVVEFVDHVNGRNDSAARSQPVVCVIHGHKQDRLLKLVTRFVQHTIPRNWSDSIARRPTHEGQLGWPDLKMDATDQALDAQLDKMFARAVSGKMAMSMDDIHNLLSSAKRNFIIRCELDEETWRHGGERVVSKILDRLVAIPRLPETILFSLIFCLEHTAPAQPGEVADADASADGSLHYGAALDATICAYHQSHPDSFHYACLQQLDLILEQDAKEWVGQPEIIRVCDDTEELRDWLDDLYEREDIVVRRDDSRPGIRMADFAKQMKQWLKAQSRAET
jgi:hypothetical protein